MERMMPNYIDKETGKQVEGWSWHVAQKEFPVWVQELFDTDTITRKGAGITANGIDVYYSGCFLTREPLSICSLQSFKAHFQSPLKCTVKRKRAANKRGYFERKYDYE